MRFPSKLPKAVSDREWIAIGMPQERQRYPSGNLLVVPPEETSSSPLSIRASCKGGCGRSGTYEPPCRK